VGSDPTVACIGPVLCCAVLRCAVLCRVNINVNGTTLSAGETGHRPHLDPGRVPVSASVVHRERNMSVLVGTLQPYVAAHHNIFT